MEQDQKDNPAQEALAEAGDDAAAQGEAWLNASLPGQESGETAAEAGQPAVDSAEGGVGQPDQAAMCLHILPVAKQLSAWLRGLPASDVQSGAVAERIASGVLAASPAAIFKNAEQIADLPNASEIFVAAAGKAPKEAILNEPKYAQYPYRGLVVETAMRAAVQTKEGETRSLVFTHVHLIVGKPFARELMLVALTMIDPDKKETGLTEWDVCRAALENVKQYEDQPYAQEIITAALALDGWAPFDEAKHYAHLPFAKDFLIEKAAAWPWALFARLYNIMDQAWVGEVVVAAINSKRMKRDCWDQALHKDTREQLMKAECGEAVWTALANKFPDLILDDKDTLLYRQEVPWGRKVLKQALERATSKTPTAALEANPLSISPTGVSLSTRVLPKDFMKPEEFERMFELSARGLSRQSPGEVFNWLSTFGDREFVPELALEASSRAPVEALAYIQQNGRKQRPPYMDEMLERATRGAVSKKPDAAIQYMSLFVGAPWAEDVALQLVEVLPDTMVATLFNMNPKPEWGERVFQKALQARIAEVEREQQSQALAQQAAQLEQL